MGSQGTEAGQWRMDEWGANAEGREECEEREGRMEGQGEARRRKTSGGE